MPQTHFQLSLITGERGQTMTETAVILALIVLVALVGVAMFSGALANLWSQLASTLPGN